MNTLQIEFELIIDNKYKELKGECETYANLEMAIERYLKDNDPKNTCLINYLNNEFKKRLKKDTPTS